MNYLLSFLLFTASTFFISETEPEKKSELPQSDVVIELFSSSTCPGCAQSDARIRSWLDEHPERDRIHIIKYPMWGPGAGCFFYHENPAPVMGRASYYGRIQRVPTAFVNGTNFGITIADWFETADTLLTTEPSLNISVNAKTNEALLEFDIEIKTLNGEPIPENSVLRSALVESNIEHDAPNGSKIHDHVVRAMFPNTRGIELKPDNIIKIRFSEPINENWDKDNLKIVLFVQQDTEEKIILGSASTSIN